MYFLSFGGKLVRIVEKKKLEGSEENNKGKGFDQRRRGEIHLISSQFYHHLPF